MTGANGHPTFTLPQTFQPMEVLPAKLWTRADDCRFLMSTIIRKTAQKDVDPWGCVRLHQTVLRRIMAPNSISGIVRALEAGGVIQTAPYRTGVKCKGYKLVGPVLGDRCVTVPATGLMTKPEIAQSRTTRLPRVCGASWAKIANYRPRTNPSQTPTNSTRG